jgi:hypothetical protein
MDTFRFGRRVKLPATSAIKHQLRRLMFDDEVKKAEAEARADMVGQDPAEAAKHATVGQADRRCLAT